MRILCIADEENKGLWDHFDKGKLKDIDLILSAGDLHSSSLFIGYLFVKVIKERSRLSLIGIFILSNV